MTLSFATVLTGLYAFCGAAGFVGYFPQIWSLWKDKTLAASTSLTTWGWWAFMSTVAFLYGLLVNKDPAVILVSASNFAGCLAVFGLGVIRRHKPYIK